MSAVKQSFYDKSRQQLYKIIPLDTPLTVVIEPSSICDLRCNFCAFSSETALNNRQHVMKNMSKETLVTIIKQLKEFPQQIKSICFTGLGEPLMNPMLPDMIKSVKESGVTQRTMVITNAVNLTQSNSLALINSGLDSIIISVNGLNADDYEKFAGRRIDYDKYVKQIAYLYANKDKLLINVKINNLCINNDNDRKYFFDTFENICDNINIDTIYNAFKDVHYDDKQSKYISKHPDVKVSRSVCSQPFYRLCISSRGKVNFCNPISDFWCDELNIHEKPLTDIWNGNFHKQLQLNQLRGEHPKCKNCLCKDELAFDEDNLDPFAEDLYKKLKESENLL